MTLSESAFEAMRPWVSKALAVSPKSLDPQAGIDDIIPRHLRRQVWRELEAAMGIKLPMLWFSPSELLNVATLAAGIWLVGAGIAVYSGSRVSSELFSAVILLLMLLAPLSIFVAARVLAHRATWLPNIRTLLDLAGATVRNNMRVFRTRYGVRPSTEEIFAMVRVALVDALGVDECEVKPGARLVQDLGAG